MGFLAKDLVPIYHVSYDITPYEEEEEDIQINFSMFKAFSFPSLLK